VTRWQPGLELTRLLEALGENIIAATDDEVRQMHGRTIAGTADEVRQLIQAARADKNEGLREDLHEDLGAGLSEPGTGPRPTGIFRRPAHHQRH
jgi:hypothetical protein